MYRIWKLLKIGDRSDGIYNESTRPAEGWRLRLVSPGQGGGLCHLVNMAMPTQRGKRRNRGKPTPVGYGEALPTFLDMLEREAKGRRQRRLHRPSSESRLPLGKTWETPPPRRQALRPRAGAEAAAPATGPTGPGELHRARGLVLGASGSPAPARPAPWAPSATAWRRTCCRLT